MKIIYEILEVLICTIFKLFFHFYLIIIFNNINNSEIINLFINLLKCIEMILDFILNI